MSDVAISLKGVSKYYKLYNDPKDRLKEALSPFGKKYHHEFYALKDINLEVKKGEILGIVGRNGSGKSTLLKLICGVLTPNGGSVHVNGKISALLELGAGFNPEFSGYKNIYFYATILGLSRQEIDEKMDDIVAFADLGEFMNQPVKTYSSGMKARLGFAVAVHIEPEILILDEVLAVGDSLFKRKCHAKMEEFFKGGKTIIYVSHDTGSITELCSRAILLDTKKVLLDSDPKTVSMYYQKILFSVDDVKVQKIKEELLALKSNGEKVEVDKNVAEEPRHEAYYVNGFLPKSQVQYKNYDVDILNVKLYVLNKLMPVNHLVKNEQYQITFDVRFHESLSHIKFGCQIKNVKGLIVTGYTFPGRQSPVPLVEDGDCYRITACFTAAFECGVYYIDVGVTSDIDGEKTYLNMIHDILCFRVQDADTDSWGLVDLWDVRHSGARKC